MKKWILLPATLLLITALQAQVPPVHKTSPLMPSIEIQLLDSTTIFHTQKLAKDKPVVLLFFHTTCDHCQKKATELVANKEKLKQFRLVMMSNESIFLTKKFYLQYGLNRINNLVIGRDYKYSGAKYYAFESFPFCAMYSKEHKFIKSLERNFTLMDILKALEKN